MKSKFLHLLNDELVKLVNLVMQSLKATKRQSDTTIFAESVKVSKFHETFAKSLKSLMSIFSSRGVMDVRLSLGQYRTDYQRISNLYLTPNRFFTRFATVFALVFVLGVGNVWGVEGDELAICQGTESGYGVRRTLTDSHGVGWVLASGQSGYLGSNSKQHSNVKPTAADLPVVKAQNASATTSTTGYYFYYTSSSVSNVGSIIFSYTANDGNTSATAYIISSSTAASSGSATWSKVSLASGTGLSAQGVNLGTSGTFTFKFASTETSAKFYGIVIVTTSYKRMTNGTITIKEGATSATPVNPTVTFSNGTYYIGSSNLNLSTLWTSNSSGVVTYSVVNANGTGATCTPAGSFSATSSGTCTVQASQAAVSGYNAISRTATITIEEAPSCDFPSATSIKVGDEIIIVMPASSKQMKSSSSGGEVVDYPNAFCPNEELKFTVTEGYDGGIALKTIDNKYLSWSSSTTVSLANSITGSGQNWVIEKVGNVSMLKNVGDNRYLLYYNNNNMRLYTSASQASTVKPTIYLINSCTELAQINGSVNLSQLAEGVNTGKLQATWPAQSNTDGWAANGIQIKIYEDGNATPVVTSEALANSTTSFTASDFTPKTCTNYYATLTALHGDDASYCAGNLVSDPSESVTTAGYSYINNSSNVNLVADLPASTCANGGADVNIQFTAAAGYRLPTEDELNDYVSVTNVGELDEDWFRSVENDVLTINLSPSKATGNVTITVNGILSLVPEISVSKTEIDFSEVKKGVATSTTFTVEGANLNNANITLSYDAVEGDNVFTFSKTTLTPSDYASPGIEITLTANTSTAGSYMGTITISDGNDGATDKSIDVYLTVLETYTVNWYVNGTQVHTQTDVANTDYDAVPSDFSAFDDCKEGLTFIGWKEGAIDGGSTTSAPSLATIGTKITANKDYYAVFAEGTPGSSQWEKITSTDDLDDGDYLIVYEDGSVAFNGGLETLDAENNTIAVSISEGVITDRPVIGAAKFTIATSGDNKTILSASGNYIGQSSDANGLSANTTEQTNTVSFDKDGNANVVSSGGAYLRYNSASNQNRFRYYKSSSYSGQKAIQLYKKNVTDPVWTKWYTTCPHCNAVALSKAGEADGNTFALQVSGSDVTSVKTCEAATVDVVPDPATGYELTGVALSGVAGASYAEGVITIPANAEGTLTATATFSQANYTVTMAQTGGASAELSADQTNKHYNDVITVTAEDKAGYVFKGWSASPAVTFANAKALETTFSMPNGNVTVTAAYAKVYTPAEALALDDLTDSVYVEGVISQVDEVSTQYKNATYWISADGTTTNQIKIYRGKHINKADVTADNAAQIAVGNKVRVRGKLSQSSNVNQFGQSASYITVLVEKTLSALTIAGDASVTTYDVGDSFDKTGLSLTATYNTGYVIANYTGTAITSNYDAPTTFTAGVTSVTVSASEGLINTERVIPVTVSSAVLDHAELASGYQTEFWAKESYKEPLLNAYLDDEPATVLANVTGVTDVSGLDMSVAGDKHVTITYTRKADQSTTVDYDFTVKPVVVDEAHAHSVATAHEIIDVDLAEKAASATGLDLAEEDTKTHVIGVVKSVSGSSPYSIVIKDQTDESLEMTLYQVTLKSGIASVEAGDVIKAYGNLYYYANNSKYEINTGEVVAVVRTPNLTVADVAEMEVNFTADLAEADLTIDRDGSNGDITFSCSDAAVTIVDNKLHAAEAGDATVTATIAASGIYTGTSTTFNVHVIAERTRYAITMDANGGSGTDPEYANELEGATVDLPATCPYSKANHAFAAWEVNETVSGDEVTITDGHFTMPEAAVTIKATWNEVATCHISFQVNGAEVATADAPETEAYSLAGISHPNVDGFTWVGWSTTKYDNETTTLPPTITSYTPAASEATKTLYGIYSRVDINGENYGKYVKVTSAPTDWSGQYLIVYEAGNKAMDGSLASMSSSENGIIVTIADGIVTATTTENKTLDGSSFTIAKAETNYSIRSASGKYIGCTVSKNGFNEHATTVYTNAISLENNVLSITSSGGPKLQCWVQNTSYRFSYYASSQNALALYKKDNGTTYYTSSPVEKVTITFNAKGGNGGCSTTTINKGSQLTICADVPTKSHSEFAGWNSDEEGNGDAYVAGTTYTFNASATIYAQWTDATPHAVTYVANGATGSVPTIEDQYAGDQFNIAAKGALEKEGFDFVGWTYNGTLYKAGVSFTMPAEAVEFVAQWKKQNITKMTLVTDVAQLINGSKVVIAQAEITDDACKTMGGQGSNNRSAVASTVDGNVISVGNETSEFTLVRLENNQFAFQASNGNYLYAASSNNNYLREQAAIDGNASWTISIASNGVATIKAQGSNTNNWMRYNSSSTLFSCYGSGQQDIAIYANVTAITDDASISDIGYVEGDVIVVSSGATLTMDAPSAPASITVKENAVVNVSAATEAGTVIVEKGAKLAIEEGGSVTTNEPLVLYTTLGKGTGTNTSGNAPGSSSEIINAERLNATGDVFIEIELTQDAKASAGWYAFSVPFPVDAMNGVYYGDTKLTNEVGYAIMSHYGELRAKDEYAWKKFRGIMQPGVFYVITVGNTDYKTLRFKKVADEALVASSSVAVSPFPTQTGNNADGAWNGIGNPNLAISNLYTSVSVMQFYDHKSNTFIGRSHSVNLVVGSAFFIQYNGGETVSIPVGTTGYEGVLAPRREQKAVEEMIYEVQLTNVATGELEDNVFLTAREDATNEYEIGRDVAKLSMGTAKCAQMWVPAYGTKLCAADFQLVNDKAEYPLTLNAPSAGTYSISMVENDAATIYLTYEGSIIWNLSMSAYELTLEKGTTEGYGLLLNAKMPMTPTGVDEVQSDKVQCTKVVIDEHVYILRGGEMYDVTGKAVK